MHEDMQRRVTAVILAGGSSSRFGTDKAFAKHNRKSFLQLVGEAVRPVSDGFLILAPFGADGPAYAKLVPGATVVPDRTSGLGPVVALRDAFELARAPTLLIVPCDAPGLPPGLVRRLVALSEELNRPAIAEPKSGPLHTLFAAPRPWIADRLPTAKKMEDLTKGGELVPTPAELLNVNQPIE